jgi:hypothetical protein
MWNSEPRHFAIVGVKISLSLIRADKDDLQNFPVLIDYVVEIREDWSKPLTGLTPTS